MMRLVFHEIVKRENSRLYVKAFWLISPTLYPAGDTPGYLIYKYFQPWNVFSYSPIYSEK